jgi:hypothetical protein
MNAISNYGFFRFFITHTMPSGHCAEVRIESYSVGSTEAFLRYPSIVVRVHDEIARPLLGRRSAGGGRRAADDNGTAIAIATASGQRHGHAISLLPLCRSSIDASQVYLGFTQRLEASSVDIEIDLQVSFPP